jgi:NADH-quinone oxidoreductase subunit N
VAGLADRRPLLAAVLTVFLISLTGVPVTAGFVGKFYLFNAAVSGGWVILAIVGGLMSAVSAFYYLRVVVAMYMREPEKDDDWGAIAPASALALAVSVAVVLVLGPAARAGSPGRAVPAAFLSAASLAAPCS